MYNRPPGQRAQHEQHTAALREVPMDELRAVFECDDVVDLDTYQLELTTSNHEAVVQQPYSSEFSSAYADSLHLLDANTSIFNPKTEEVIATDPVIEVIQRVRDRDRNNREVTRVLRIRRSIVAFLLEHCGSQVDDNTEGTSDSGLSPTGTTGTS